MAVWNGNYLYENYLIEFWRDPNRFRAMVWKKQHLSSEFYCINVRRMHDKDLQRLNQRVKAWVRKQLV